MTKSYMSEYFLLIPILMPIVAGILLLAVRPSSSRFRNIYVFFSTLVTSIFVIVLIVARPQGTLEILSIADNITFELKLDGLGTVFAGIMAVMWPLATLYAFEYMKHDKKLNMFFGAYTCTYGVALGIALSANALTMYLFYEFLTLVTTPLVLHTQTRAAVKASRKYLYYSITGAAIGFITIIFILVLGQNAEFVYGGFINLDSQSLDRTIECVVYVLAFVGFGVKAAIFPLHGWLPSASVAPTPVTALLHAVAVVKSGVFVIIRMTYYVFSIDMLSGTWAQATVMIIAVVTILYASIMAIREKHFKRRLAYSTMSNLSYILVGVCMMSPLGLLAALAHMVFHAVMKISSFFCAGAVMEYAKLNYVHQLSGLAKKMPFTFTCFTISALSLMGMPGLVGFISKYRLINSAVLEANTISYIAIFALFCSSIFVAIYLVSIAVKAFFCEPVKNISNARDPGVLMKIPISIFTVLIVVLGVYSTPVIEYLSNIAYGLF